MHLTNNGITVHENDNSEVEKNNPFEMGITGRPVVGQKEIFTRLSLLFSDRSTISPLITSQPGSNR